jgi:hypothetical protein
VVSSLSVYKLRLFGAAIASVVTVELCSVQKKSSQAIYSLFMPNKRIIGFANFDTIKSDCLSPEQNTQAVLYLSSQETIMFEQFRN